MNPGYILAVTAAALWGLTYCLDEKVLAEISIYKLYFLHSLFGVLLALSIWLFQGNSVGDLITLEAEKISWKLLLLTLVVGSLAALAIFGSIQALGASKASILEISYPLFVAIFAFLLWGQVITLPVLLGGILIFVGSAIIILWG